MEKTVKFISLLVGFVFLTQLISCGQNVCVAGVGKCEVPKEVRDKQAQTTTSGPSAVTALKGAFVANRFIIPQGEQITLTGLGGKTPYTYAMITDATTGAVGEKDGVFTAPKNKATAKVKITDDSKASVEIQIDIP